VDKAIELTGKGPLANEPSKVFKGGEQGFVPLTLDKVEDINHNTKKFRFKFEDPEAVSGLHIASALVTKFQKEGDEKPTIKPYTPTSDEDQKGFLDFIIKKYPNGPVCNIGTGSISTGHLIELTLIHTNSYSRHMLTIRSIIFR
jgi:NAD(P)H-flavin reductase